MERARAIYDYAIDLQPEERRVFLEQISSEDPELLVQVQRMLDQAQADTEDIPATPVDSPVARLHKYIFSPGDLIAGRYRVLRKVAKGGMGEVYEVKTWSYSRVALKVISFKSAASPIQRRCSVAKFCWPGKLLIPTFAESTTSAITNMPITATSCS